MVWKTDKKFRLNIKAGFMVEKWTGRERIIISDQ